MTLVRTYRSANITSSPFVIQLATLSEHCFYPKGQYHFNKENMQMNFMIFLLSSTSWKSSQAMPTFNCLGVYADCPHKNQYLRLCLVMEKTACPKEGMKSGVNRDSHSGKNCHHFFCAPARTTYGSPADKYNLFLFFPISHAHFICGILKLHTKCLLTPWHHSLPRLGCAISQNPPVQLWKG